MANPIQFVPNYDPRRELRKQLDAAPVEHAEALLVCFQLIQTAHDNGMLDLLHGLIGGRDIIAGKLAEYAKLPGGIAAIRNLMAGAKLLMVLDPDTLDQLTKSVVTATGQHKAEAKPPSLWQLAKRATSEDSRRGLSFVTLLLDAVGKSLRVTPETHVK